MRATALIVLVIYILKILISSVVLDSSAFLQRTVVVNHDALGSCALCVEAQNVIQ